MPLEDIEAICIDTRDVNLAVAAAARMREAGVGNIKILTDEDGVAIARRADFNATAIQKLETIDAYSKFMIEQAHEHVTSDHFLVFQWDGFIINPHLWWDGFLEYDYIGAPWPQPYRPTPDLKVGNGGFSLRSRSLAEALSKGYNPNTDTPEDVYIAIQLQNNTVMRKFLTAPTEIARHFSAEHQTYLNADQPFDKIPKTKTLGFHGWFNFFMAADDNLLLHYVNNVLNDNQRKRILCSWSNTALLVNLINRGRVDIANELSAITAATLGITFSKGAGIQSLINFINNKNS